MQGVWDTRAARAACSIFTTCIISSFGKYLDTFAFFIMGRDLLSVPEYMQALQLAPWQ